MRRTNKIAATLCVVGVLGCSEVTVEKRGARDEGTKDDVSDVSDASDTSDTSDVSNMSDAAHSDAGDDTGARDIGSVTDGGALDAGQDGGQDAGQDGGQDAGQDGGQDAGQDGGQDAGQDGGQDAGQDGGQAFAGMLLSAAGGTLTLPGGAPVEFSGAISCCGGAYGWPVFDEAWVDYVDGYGVKFLHARLGPFLTGEGGESDWTSTGGGYVETGGKADLSRFNTAFWARVRALIEYAGGKGIWVEVDIADGWGMKHCRWGDTPGYSAWDPAGNIQGEDWCDDAGSREIIGADVHEQWVRKAVFETGRYGNVIYQDGNEIGIVGGYAPEWTLSIRNIVRDEESRNGYARHLLGTNSGDEGVIKAVGIDFAEFHQDGAADPGQCHGKPCLVNEYNPDPPLTPEELHAEFCAARSMGTYFWYWRHGQTKQQMDQTLGLIAGGCD
ncbi:MAG: hypothetical protein HY897_20885 [Deltaproteobacteria bacterium]|nr:hypothetical protein [Deltaproteobacteria bacterium]